jgi:hypothetical protein
LMVSFKMPKKRYGLFVLAILLLLLGLTLFVGSNNFTIRSLGFAALMGSLHLVRISNVHRSTSLNITSDQAANHLGYPMWILGFALLLLWGVFYLLLYIDALHGSQTVWPVYLFAGVGIACAGIWGYIASKLV